MQNEKPVDYDNNKKHLQSSVDKCSSKVSFGGDAVESHAAQLLLSLHGARICSVSLPLAGHSAGCSAVRLTRYASPTLPIHYQQKKYTDAVRIYFFTVGKGHEFDTKCTRLPCSRLLSEHPWLFPFALCDLRLLGEHPRRYPPVLCAEST